MNNHIAAALPQDETIVTIPWSQLHDSPLQYRQTYSEATIAEIAASIVATGRIHQPLVVRLHYPNPLFRDQYDPQDGFEIVFGHTRKRGGMLAGLAGAPCVVRDLSDAQVRAAQAAENIARADVHALEEAQGFRAMIDGDGVTADELAAQLGKSRSYVYSRMKLLALCPEVRSAVLAGEIGTEVGLLIARVGSAKMQGKALGYIKGKHYDLGDGGKKSFRGIRDLLNERFTLALKDAIFDVDDEMLVPSAGYCGRCPKRSGNAPEFIDIASPEDKHVRGSYGIRHTGADICTDPDCFSAKRNAHLVREAGRLEASGKTVISADKARAALSATGEVKGAYVDASKVRDLLKKVNASADKATPMPRVVLIQDQRTGKTVQAVSRADLRLLGAAVPETPEATNGFGNPEEQARHQRVREAERAKVASECAKRRALLNQVRAATRTALRSEFDLRLVARVTLAGVHYEDKLLLAELWGWSRDMLDKRIETMDLADVGQFMLDCALVSDTTVHSVYQLKILAEPLQAAAAHYGVVQTAEGTPTPSAAGARAKKATAGAGQKHGAPRAGQGNDEEAAARPEQLDEAGVAGGGVADDGAQVDLFAGVVA